VVEPYDDEITLDAKRDERDERDARPAPPSLAPTSLARTMRNVPERPRPRATSAIIVGLLVSAASAATVLGLGHRVPSPYPPVTSSAGAVGRYTVSASQPARPAATDEAVTAFVTVPDAGHTDSRSP
jgi:hypothetical protein